MQPAIAKMLEGGRGAGKFRVGEGAGRVL